MGTAMAVRPHFGPYTVDDLFELPPEFDNLRCEVIDGNLIVSPAATPLHQVIGYRLCRLIDDALPLGVDVIITPAVRMPGGDGPIPDLVVTTGDFRAAPSGFRAEDVHTVVEVVSPSNANHDRIRKRDRYAEAGIPCYWRVEPNPWREHRGPLPVIVVRLRTGLGRGAASDAPSQTGPHEPDGWRTIMAPAGREHELPVAVGRGPTDLVTVRLDPSALVARR